MTISAPIPFRIRKPSPFGSERGNILVVCMVLAGLGTLGVASFFSLMEAKLMEAEQAITASERRTKRANSLALAKEVVQRKYIAAATGPVAAETHTLPGGWGECTISPFTGAPMGSTDATRTHKTGAMPFKSYSFDIDVEIGDGDIRLPRQFQVKSCNPLLGGDLLYMGQPTLDTDARNTLGGNLYVKGRARFWTGGDRHSISVKADQYVGVDPKKPLLALDNTAGQPAIAQNIPFPKITAGRHGGATTPSFDGTGNVIGNPDATWNSYQDKILVSGNHTLLDGEIATAAATLPPTLDDPALIVAISGPTGQVEAALTPYHPLSSPVLTAAWNAGLPSAILERIFLNNSPLPLDVLQLVIDDTALPTAVRQEILDANANASDGAGGITLDLDSFDSGHIIARNVESLVIGGQADATAFADAAALEPTIVLVHNDAASARTLNRIEFQGGNNRRLILAVKQNADSASPVALVHTGNAFPEWRMLATFENVPFEADFSAVSSATLKGGIWTDRSLEVPNGSVTIVPETDPGDLEWMAGRVAWIEVFRAIPAGGG